jgi:hypothetical protein
MVTQPPLSTSDLISRMSLQLMLFAGKNHNGDRASQPDRGQSVAPREQYAFPRLAHLTTAARPAPGVIRAQHCAHLQFSKSQHAQTRLALGIQNQAKIEIRLPHLLANRMAIRYL